MTSALSREDVVRRMARCLQALGDADLDCWSSRDDSYRAAGFRSDEIVACDEEALRVERLRRRTFAAPREAA